MGNTLTLKMRLLLASLFLIIGNTTALTRPPAPSFNGPATFSGNAVTIPFNTPYIPSDTFTNINYHVLLLRDLSISIEAALREAIESNAEVTGFRSVGVKEYRGVGVGSSNNCEAITKKCRAIR